MSEQDQGRAALRGLAGAADILSSLEELLRVSLTIAIGAYAAFQAGGLAGLVAYLESVLANPPAGTAGHVKDGLQKAIEAIKLLPH